MTRCRTTEKPPHTPYALSRKRRLISKQKRVTQRADNIQERLRSGRKWHCPLTTSRGGCAVADCSPMRMVLLKHRPPVCDGILSAEGLRWFHKDLPTRPYHGDSRPRPLTERLCNMVELRDGRWERSESTWLDPKWPRR